MFTSFFLKIIVDPLPRQPNRSSPTKKDAPSHVGNTQQYENVEGEKNSI